MLVHGELDKVVNDVSQLQVRLTIGAEIFKQTASIHRLFAAIRTVQISVGTVQVIVRTTIVITTNTIIDIIIIIVGSNSTCCCIVVIVIIIATNTISIIVIIVAIGSIVGHRARQRWRVIVESAIARAVVQILLKQTIVIVAIAADDIVDGSTRANLAPTARSLRIHRVVGSGAIVGPIDAHVAIVTAAVSVNILKQETVLTATQLLLLLALLNVYGRRGQSASG